VEGREGQGAEEHMVTGSDEDEGMDGIHSDHAGVKLVSEGVGFKGWAGSATSTPVGKQARFLQG
jgi:hypothetical protein